jgi:hypothetical protein
MDFFLSWIVLLVLYLKTNSQLRMVTHICNPSTQEAEAERSQVQGQPKLYRELVKNQNSWALLAHACNPSYSGGRDQEDQGSKPAWANSLGDPILKKTITKKGWWSASRYRP